MRRAFAVTMVLAAMVAAPGTSGAQEKKTPYWASISAGEAMMRTGPGRNFPAQWLYRRADLPIRVVEVYPSWRKVQDPDGTTGWMLVNLLSDTRTAIVRGSEARPLRREPSRSAPVAYLAPPGVVGRISKCGPEWCRIDVTGHAGFIETAHIWGVDKGETLP
jgi:SH3-like domain-containing protein